MQWKSAIKGTDKIALEYRNWVSIHIKSFGTLENIWVCMREREGESIWVRIWEREREREHLGAHTRERERAFGHAYE